MGTHKPVPPRPFTPKASTRPPPLSTSTEIPSFASPFVADDATTIYRARRNAEAAQGETVARNSSPPGTTGPPRGVADADQTKIFHAPDELLEQAKRNRAERRRSKSAVPAQNGAELNARQARAGAAGPSASELKAEREMMEGDTVPPPARATEPPSKPISVLPDEPVVVLQHAIGDRLEERDTSIFRVQEDQAAKARETRARRKEQRAAERASSAPGSVRPTSHAPVPAAPTGSAPGHAAPTGSAPGHAAPTGSAPGHAVPARSAPGSAPRHVAPARSAPTHSAPVLPPPALPPPAQPPAALPPPAFPPASLTPPPLPTSRRATSPSSPDYSDAPPPVAVQTEPDPIVDTSTDEAPTETEASVRRGPVLALADIDVDMPADTESIPPFRKKRMGLWLIAAVALGTAVAYALRTML